MLRRPAFWTSDGVMHCRTFFLLVLLHVGVASAQSKLNLNAATKEQLAALGLTESQALQVISYREKTGPLLQVEELQAVPQISKPTFEKIRDRVTVDE